MELLEAGVTCARIDLTVRLLGAAPWATESAASRPQGGVLRAVRSRLLMDASLGAAPTAALAARAAGPYAAGAAPDSVLRRALLAELGAHAHTVSPLTRAARLMLAPRSGLPLSTTAPA